MTNISIGANFIVTGMVVVFITLAVMSAAMWLVGKLLRGGKEKRKEAVQAPEDSAVLNEGELAAVTAAIHQYSVEQEGYILNFEQLSRWKTQGRMESLERSP